MGGGDVTGEGLSPLTRGNLKTTKQTRCALGPIPAHAGEPIPEARINARAWAYPRSRGGTAGRDDIRIAPMGLSPLTRGNPKKATGVSGGFRPIPAHAGEPADERHARVGAWAYPRSRGGTAGTALNSILSQGLSPLTRGNRSRNATDAPHKEPIPPHAAEPLLAR